MDSRNSCLGCPRRTITCHASCGDYEKDLARIALEKKRRKEDIESRMSASNGWCYDCRAVNSKG